jgi:hypothetical protein
MSPFERGNTVVRLEYLLCPRMRKLAVADQNTETPQVQILLTLGRNSVVDED